MAAIRLLLATLALLVLAALAPALASAAPAVTGEFALSATPTHLTQGPDGNVWVALTGGANDIAKVTPDGNVAEFDLPGVTNPNGIASGPDGNLWATHTGGVVRFAPANPTGATDFPVAQITDPRAIVVGPDHNLWTASADQAIEITTAGVATPFPVTGMGARGIASGGDGKLYIADFGGQRIVGLTTSGVATFYPTGGGPQEVVAGPGTQIAYTDPGHIPEQIGRIAPGTLTPAAMNVPNIDPTGIVLGNDGAYWIANFGGNTLSRFTTDGAVTSLSGLSANAGPRYITTGPGNTLWVGLETAMKVARVTGVEPPPPAPNPKPKPPKDTKPPQLSHLSLPKLVRIGTTATIRVTLSEAATLTLRFERRLSGRRTKAGRCVAPTRTLRHAHRCTRFAKAGSLTRHARRGIVKLAFAGRIGHRRLAVGSYRLTITAKDAAGNVGKPVRATFSLAAARKRKAHR